MTSAVQYNHGLYFTCVSGEEPMENDDDDNSWKLLHSAAASNVVAAFVHELKVFTSQLNLGCIYILPRLFKDAEWIGHTPSVKVTDSLWRELCKTGAGGI